jgi:putative flippase GtrA
MRSNKQYEDSAKLAEYAMLGGILTLVGMVIYNMIVYGVS